MFIATMPTGLFLTIVAGGFIGIMGLVFFLTWITHHFEDKGIAKRKAAREAEEAAHIYTEPVDFGTTKACEQCGATRERFDLTFCTKTDWDCRLVSKYNRYHMHVDCEDCGCRVIEKTKKQTAKKRKENKERPSSERIHPGARKENEFKVGDLITCKEPTYSCKPIIFSGVHVHKIRHIITPTNEAFLSSLSDGEWMPLGADCYELEKFRLLHGNEEYDQEFGILV